jgi:hypothetical protein
MIDETTDTGSYQEPVNTAQDPDELLINALTDDESGNEQSQDDGSPEPKPEVQRFKVKVKGEEEEVELEKLIKRYELEEAGHRNMEEAARLRKEVEADREQYLQGLQQSQQFIDKVAQQAQLWAQEGQPNWQELLENNPHEYLKQQEIFKQRQATLQAAQQQHAYLKQQQDQEQQRQLQQHLAKESERLVNDLIPEWKNPEVRQKDEQELISYLRDAGYSDQDLINLNHSRADNIVLARKAMLYDRALKKANSLKKQTPTAANPVPTVGNKAPSKGTKSIFDPNLSDDEYDRRRREQRRNAR